MQQGRNRECMKNKGGREKGNGIRNAQYYIPLAFCKEQLLSSYL